MRYRHFKWLELFFALYLPTATGAVEMTEDCITEPIFQNKVCTYQTNPRAANTILLVHGIGERASHDWDKQLESLSQHYRVVTLDLPGFGDSGHGDQRYTPEHYVAVLEHIAEHYQLSQFDLVGHSMGGAIALLYAAQHPQRVRRLVLVDVAGILHRLAIAKYDIASLFGHNQKEIGKYESYVVKIIEKFDKLYPFIREGVAPLNEKLRAGIELVDYDFSNPLNQLTAPTLIIWGDNDHIAPTRTAKALQYRIRDARLEVISGSGHVLIREKSGQFNTLLLTFFLTEESQNQPHDSKDNASEEVSSATCKGKSGKLYTGTYTKLTIKNCSGVVIKNARIKELDIYESRVVIENSHIGGDVDIAMNLVGSDVEMTAGILHGNSAITTKRSRVDLAAVDMIGNERAIRSLSNSHFIISISSIKDSIGTRTVHKSATLVAGESL